MDHAGAFVQDVVSHPHDDAPRLIYADWLLDQGDPAARARAELIRVQYALEDAPEGDPRRPALEQRQRDVLATYGAHWTSELAALGVRKWHFRRGFVEGVTIDPRGLLDRGDAIASLAPVRELELLPRWDFPSRGYWDGWSRLPHAAASLLPQIEALDVSGVPSLQPADLRHTLVSGKLPRLTHLATSRLAAAVLVTAGADAPKLDSLCIRHQGAFPLPDVHGLFTAPCVEGLKRLGIGVGVGDEELIALARSPLLARLEGLSLRECQLNEPLGRRLGAVRSSTPPRLRLAELIKVGPSAQTLFPAYPTLPDLLSGVESLNLASNRLDLACVELLARGPFPSLRRLVLDGNTLGRDGAKRLARSDLLASLESLSLRTARLGDAGLALLCNGRPLRELNVSYNGITAGGVRELGEYWPDGLATLDLSWNPCRSEGVKALCAEASFAGLKALDLSYCELGDGAAQALAASPGLKDLETLNLSTNRLGDAGLIALAESPHLRELRSLHLGDTAVGDEGVRGLLDSPLLAKLEVLMLNGTRVSEPMRERLRRTYGGILG